MKKKFDIFSRWWQKIKDSVNKEFLTYLVFLLIAIVIWYLNALNEVYSSEFNFAVRYTDMPDDKVLANTPPDRLLLTINAQGFTLLKYRLGLTLSPITLEASYNTLRRKNNAQLGEYYFTTQSAFNRISTQLSSDAELKNVLPDTLFFVFTETVSKEIEVASTLQLEFEKGFLPKGDIIIEPEKVMVTGPLTVIDTMQYVYTRTRTFRRLRDTLRISIDLQPVQQLRFSTNEVRIEQAIQRFTEATITAPIETINVPEGMTMRVFPGMVTINCMAPVADYEKLQPHTFRIVVDYNSVMGTTDDNQTRARVLLVRAPDYATDVRFHPNNVDFIIEQ